MDEATPTTTASPPPRSTVLDGQAHLAVAAGAGLALAGYLLPWFKKQDGYLWWYSGWEYADLSNGGGWTLVAIGLLCVSLLTGFWTGRSRAATVGCLVSGIAGAFWSAAVIAASFSTMGERSSLNGLTELPFGIGMPLLAAGLGLSITMAGYQLIRHLISEHVDF
ncbi:hypothetical protein [Catellatospora tritici]|uniref:hypothetical protein n=1 Tax=Catellatospora tritici TaxID=2851566 RepID=UPI001C2D0C99|nr:hypothetical protein [Catellatospora tritici]MBV1851271.1 hypothetical protein [Catellatospora tritici]